MNRFLVSLATVAVAGSASLQATGTDPQLDYNVLQGRIASLESKVKMLETALNELSAQVAAEPAPTQKVAPAPPAPEKKPVADAPKPTEPAPTPPVEAATELAKYQIQEGDTISEIARKLSVPRAELMEANSLREGQQIYIGDELLVPQPKAAAPDKAVASNTKTPAEKPAPAEKKPAPASKGSGTYVVKSGDTLTKIAREHGITVASLKSANNLKSDLINGGQKLTIPGAGGGSAPEDKEEATVAGADQIEKLLRPEESYGVYTVERGDTLYSLARDFFTSASEIQRLNRLGKSTVLKPGQDLVVPTSAYEEHHKLAKNG